MQVDMHFYGTYAVARYAGIPASDAYIIAYAAQFVDDSSKNDSKTHEDKGMMWGIATAHHSVDCVKNATFDSSEQRRVWVPFHFLPGGEGTSFEEKIICTKDSKIVNELFSNHIEKAIDKRCSYGLHLLGIMSHVYMDTFAHYGFSGLSSSYNEIENGSIKTHTELTPETKSHMDKKDKEFVKNYTPKVKKSWIKFKSFFAEMGSQGLGHGAVLTNPDKPFLHWSFTFEKDRLGKGKFSERNNPETFLEGCEKLHKKLSDYAKKKYNDPHDYLEFKDVRDDFKDLLAFQGEKEKRIPKWQEFIDKRFKNTQAYDHQNWHQEKEKITTTSSSANHIELDLYKFHQAATYHRYFVLKDLLPSKGIMVY